MEPMKGEWKCVLIESGGQCVMTPGVVVMPELYADSLDTLQAVTND